MRKIFWCLICFVQLGVASCWAHEEQAPVVIDTDMALDDVRAVSLLLSSQHLKVKAIVTSDGASSAAVGCENLRRILLFLGREEIPIGAGRPLDAPPPSWRGISETLGGAELSPAAKSNNQSIAPDAVQGLASSTGSDSRKNTCFDSVSVILNALQEADGGVSYLCIGPLTNLADILNRNPAVRDRIKSIFFYGTLPQETDSDWNTSRDLQAAKTVFAAGIPLYVFRLRDEQLLGFDAGLLGDIHNFNSPASRLISLLHREERTQKLLSQGHFKAWDETVALYMDNPRLGSFTRADGQYPIFRLANWEREAARASYLEILSRSEVGKLEQRIPVVLESYPMHPSQFQEDLRPWVAKIIAMHGIEEWKATVLTNELHRHLGIYSILGAKMGILAREMLNASLDELTVESHASLKPPLSCLNDGLQVATGASLGRGTITVRENGGHAMEAVFSQGNKRLRLRLKDSVRERIKADIQHAVERYGDMTPEYFREIRRLSFHYWADMKRGEIFDQEFYSP
jgi:pyrimidine-specific ribonucleoside hydrolase